MCQIWRWSVKYCELLGDKRVWDGWADRQTDWQPDGQMVWDTTLCYEPNGGRVIMMEVYLLYFCCNRVDGDSPVLRFSVRWCRRPLMFESAAPNSLPIASPVTQYNRQPQLVCKWQTSGTLSLWLLMSVFIFLIIFIMSSSKWLNSNSSCFPSSLRNLTSAHIPPGSQSNDRKASPNWLARKSYCKAASFSSLLIFWHARMGQRIKSAVPNVNDTRSTQLLQHECPQWRSLGSFKLVWQDGHSRNVCNTLSIQFDISETRHEHNWLRLCKMINFQNATDFQSLNWVICGIPWLWIMLHTSEQVCPVVANILIPSLL